MYSQNNTPNLALVETIVGLTNYSHPPALRAPSPYMESTMMDELVTQNVSTGVSPTQLKHYSAHLSGLMTNPSEYATIRNGFSEYNKGLMKLTFALNTGGISETMLTVVGYITNNDLEGELSENAMFTPVYSVKNHRTMTAGAGHDGLTAVRETIGLRTDYLINDGSHSQARGLASVRPGDVMGAAGDNLAYDDVMMQAQSEGIEGFNVVNTTSTGAINQMGIICSNRKNYNPTRYAEELLGSAVNAQKRLMHTSCADGMYGQEDGSQFSNEMSIISEISATLLNNESKAAYDEFLNYMKDLNGSTTYRGFRGWQIRDIVNMFPNFGQTIPPDGFVHMDRNRFQVIDYTEIARAFGTSSPMEVIAQELVFNLLDVLISNDLGELSLSGSNYKHMPTEDRLSNIIIVPYNGFPLGDNSSKLQYNMIQAAETLRHQIFNKLNGQHINSMTPIEFEVKAELFGFTEVRLSAPSEEHPEGIHYFFAFPTYAPSPWSPIFSDVESADQLARGVYANVKSYFLK